MDDRCPTSYSSSQRQLHLLDWNWLLQQIKPAAKLVNNINHSGYLRDINEVLRQCKTWIAAAKAVLLEKSKKFSFHCYQNSIFHKLCIYLKLWLWTELSFYCHDREESVEADPCWLLGTPKFSTRQEHVPSDWTPLLDLCFFNWCLLLRKPKVSKCFPKYIGWGRKNKYKTPRIMFLWQKH